MLIEPVSTQDTQTAATLVVSQLEEMAKVAEAKAYALSLELLREVIKCLVAERTAA